jgi:hypothetical protein
MGRKSNAKMNRFQNKFIILEFPDGNYLIFLLEHISSPMPQIKVLQSPPGPAGRRNT